MENMNIHLKVHGSFASHLEMEDAVLEPFYQLRGMGGISVRVHQRKHRIAFSATMLIRSIKEEIFEALERHLLAALNLLLPKDPPQH